MSIFSKIKETIVGSNESKLTDNQPEVQISREVNSQLYNDYLTSLTSSFFMHQAICASKATGAPVRINLLQNALNSNGSLSSQITPNGMGIYNFMDFCKTVKVTPTINNSNDVVYYNMKFSNNVLNNPTINQQQLAEDIANISNVHEAILATYGGTNRDFAYATNLTGVELLSFSSIYNRNPQTAFNSDCFEYPDGHLSPNAKEVTDQMMAQDPSSVANAIQTITGAAMTFQQEILKNQQVFNVDYEANF